MNLRWLIVPALLAFGAACGDAEGPEPTPTPGPWTMPTPTAEATPTAEVTPTAAATPTAEATPTAAATPTAEATPTPTPLPTPTQLPSPTPGISPTPEMCGTCADPLPVGFVHGIGGSADDFALMGERLVMDGWPADRLYFFEAANARWTCNVDNAEAIAQMVAEARETHCSRRVHLVAHSMGGLSSRHYMKFLGGADEVSTYLSLGSMHHGLRSPCFAPDRLGVCVWQELCERGDFIAALNAEPATPGEGSWVTIYGTEDATVPNESTIIEGAENIEIPGAEHARPNGLLDREDVYAEVLRVLGYRCPESEAPEE